MQLDFYKTLSSFYPVLDSQNNGQYV